MRIAIAITTLAWPLLAAETPATGASDSVLQSNGTKTYALESLEEAVDTSTAIETKTEAAPENVPDQEPSGEKPEAKKKKRGPAAVKNDGFKSLDLGGSLQFKAFHHDLTANRDNAKELGFSLSKFLLDLKGTYNKHFGLHAQLLLEANGRSLGSNSIYGYYQHGLWKLRAGKIKKPFSMEALQKTDALYTVERGRLYHKFLEETTGYAYYDVGAVLKGGFEDEGVEVSYEAGVFNGKQSQNGYSGSQYEAEDAAFKAKDFAGRVALKGFYGFEAELAFSTKTAESQTNAENVDFHANAAYEAGIAYTISGVRFQGEMAWGANHQGKDSLIVAGSSEFLAFYAMLLWRREYDRGRASETLLKIEGLDPDMTLGDGGGKPNDGKFRYTAGANYFFTPRISLLLNYGILHPITEARSEGHLVQDVDLLWRLNF